MTPLKFQQLLSGAKPLTPEGADLVLDLREILLENGHAGTCVSCFFSLLGDLEQPGVLNPLKHWLEAHLVVAVQINGETRERLPVKLGNAKNLQDYCLGMVGTIRNDRAYEEDKIHLSFQYSDSSPGLVEAFSLDEIR